MPTYVTASDGTLRCFPADALSAASYVAGCGGAKLVMTAACDVPAYAYVDEWSAPGTCRPPTNTRHIYNLDAEYLGTVYYQISCGAAASRVTGYHYYPVKDELPPSTFVKFQQN